MRALVVDTIPALFPRDSVFGSHTRVAARPGDSFVRRPLTADEQRAVRQLARELWARRCAS